MNYKYQNIVDYIWNNNNENTAVIDKDVKLTYQDLKDNVYALSTYLIDIGMKKNDKVLYSLPPCKEFVILSLSVSLIGAVCAGIPYGMPIIGIEKVINDLNPKLFVCDNVFKEEYSSKFNNVVSFDDLSFDVMNIELVNRMKSNVLLDDPAFILYTSGTVNAPKGAIITHKNIISECIYSSKNLFKSIGLSDKDIFLHSFPVNHVSGCIECAFIPLYIGSTIVFQNKFHPVTFIENIKKYNITIVCGVPAMWQMIIDCIDNYHIEPFYVRGCLSGAAILKDKLKDRIKTLCDCFENPMGMTEASGFITYSNNEDNGSIGKIFDDIEYKILKNEEGIGELLIKGDNIISGYYNFDINKDSDGYYHTNDIVYEDKNRYLYLCGRSDDMFTVGGYNVYPAEIENVIIEYPGIKECLVLPIPHIKMGNVCRCYLTANKDIDLKDLEKFAEERLLSYKVPRNYIILDSFPLNGSGKINKKILQDKIKEEFNKE